MSYQAVIRNAGDQLVTNQGVGLKVSIFQNLIDGTAVYQEIYNPNPETNNNGLLTRRNRTNIVRVRSGGLAAGSGYGHADSGVVGAPLAALCACAARGTVREGPWLSIRQIKRPFDDL